MSTWSSQSGCFATPNMLTESSPQKMMARCPWAWKLLRCEDLSTSEPSDESFFWESNTKSYYWPHWLLVSVWVVFGGSTKLPRELLLPPGVDFFPGMWGAWWPPYFLVPCTNQQLLWKTDSGTVLPKHLHCFLMSLFDRIMSHSATALWRGWG